MYRTTNKSKYLLSYEAMQPSYRRHGGGGLGLWRRSRYGTSYVIRHVGVKSVQVTDNSHQSGTQNQQQNQGAGSERGGNNGTGFGSGAYQN